MKRLSSLIALGLLLLVFTGCSKHSPDTAKTNPKVFNLGNIEVSDGVTNRVDLGSGRVFIIAPTILKDGVIELDCRIEDSGKLLASPRMQTSSGIPAMCNGGSIAIELTPHIKQ